MDMNLLDKIKLFSFDQSGSVVVEYALVAGILAIGCITALGDVQDAVAALLRSIAAKLSP